MHLYYNNITIYFLVFVISSRTKTIWWQIFSTS